MKILGIEQQKVECFGRHVEMGRWWLRGGHVVIWKWEKAIRKRANFPIWGSFTNYFSRWGSFQTFSSMGQFWTCFAYMQHPNRQNHWRVWCRWGNRHSHWRYVHAWWRNRQHYWWYQYPWEPPVKLASSKLLKTRLFSGAYQVFFMCFLVVG